MDFIRKNAAYAIAAALVVVTIAAIIATVASRTGTSISLGAPKGSIIPAKNQTDAEPLPTVPPLSPNDTSSALGIVLVGYGGAGHDGGYLTDAMQLMYVDFSSKRIALVSIPRDLYVKLPDGSETKINAALVNGAGKSDKKTGFVNAGSPVLRQVVSAVTGLPADYAVGIDFVGFQRAVGLVLKGIDVNVAETLDDPWYPVTGKELETCGKTPEEVADLSKKYSGFELEKQFPCRYEHLLFKPGGTHMDGGDAIKYVRSRHGSSEGDVSRGKRQQEVLAAVAQKMVTLKALNDIPAFFMQVSKHIQTDITVDIVKKLSPSIVAMKDFKVTRINLSTSNVLVSSTSNQGAYIMIPKEGSGKWAGVQAYVKSQLGK